MERQPRRKVRRAAQYSYSKTSYLLESHGSIFCICDCSASRKSSHWIEKYLDHAFVGWSGSNEALFIKRNRCLLFVSSSWFSRPQLTSTRHQYQKCELDAGVGPPVEAPVPSRKALVDWSDPPPSSSSISIYLSSSSPFSLSTFLPLGLWAYSVLDDFEPDHRVDERQ